MKRAIGVVLFSAAATWMFAACSGKSGDNAPTSASSMYGPATDGTPSVDAAATVGSGGTGGASATSGQGGMMGQGGTSSTSASAASVAASNGSSAASTSASSSASSAAASSSSTGVQLINGCDPAKATDMTNMATVDATPAAHVWTFGYQYCLKVSKNTKVTWTGDYTMHPLFGGNSPTKDAASQITQLNATSGTKTVNTTFKQAGTFPFFCGIHTGTMMGVVFVQ